MEMAPEEIKASLAFPEVDDSGLVRVQAETEVGHQLSCELVCSLGLLPGRAGDDEIIRVADKLADATLSPGPVESVQVDVGQERR